MNDCIDCKRTATLAASVRRSSCGEQDCNMKNGNRKIEREDEGKEGGEGIWGGKWNGWWWELWTQHGWTEFRWPTF